MEKCCIAPVAPTLTRTWIEPERNTFNFIEGNKKRKLKLNVVYMTPIMIKVMKLYTETDKIQKTSFQYKTNKESLKLL